MKNLSLFALLALFAIACKPQLTPSQQDQVNKIDTLITVADSLYLAMLSVNDSAMAKELPEVKKLYKTIATSNPDSADKRFWIRDVNRLELVYSSYTKFLKDKNSIEEKLAESKKQLQTLKNSVVDSKLDSTQAARYLKEETEALAAARFKFNKRHPSAVVATQLWDTTRLYFVNMAEVIKSKK